MSTVHFVYAVPLPKNRVLRKLDRYLRRGSVVPPLHRWGFLSKIDWPDPIYAPYSITFNVYEALKKQGKVKLYDWKENIVCDLKKDDILLFHPKPLFAEDPWTRPDPNSIGWRTLIAHRANKKFVIVPYSHDPKLVLWLQPLLEYPISGFIAIGGEYWTNTWSLSPLRDSVKNVCPVIMGIDATTYPLVKKSFNRKFKRKYLYIGTTAFYKNTEQLEAITKLIPDFQGGYISRGKIEGWNKIADFANLTPEFMSKLAEEYDIFVSTSTSDAQATTILEQMCFGLHIACTPESGYTYDSMTPLSTHDTQFNKKQLEKLQTIDESVLLESARKNRAYALEKHNWDVFCDKIINFIERDFIEP